MCRKVAEKQVRSHGAIFRGSLLSFVEDLIARKENYVLKHSARSVIK